MSVKNLVGALYTGDKDKASSALDSVLNAKKDEALQVKKVAVAADIFNARNVKG